MSMAAQCSKLAPRPPSVGQVKPQTPAGRQNTHKASGSYPARGGDAIMQNKMPTTKVGAWQKDVISVYSVWIYVTFGLDRRSAAIIL